MIDVFTDKWREIIKATAETTDFEESRVHTSHRLKNAFESGVFIFRPGSEDDYKVNKKAFRPKWQYTCPVSDVWTFGNI